MTQSSVGDVPEDTASPQMPKRISSRWIFFFQEHGQDFDYIVTVKQSNVISLRQ
jgi:hypothetical protein